jgi:NADH-quinone oxidoreductase subunit L
MTESTPLLAFAQGFWASHGWLVLAFPLLSFLVNGLYLGARNRTAAGYFSIAMAAASMITALAIAVGFFSALAAQSAEASRSVIPWEFVWMPLQGDFAIKMGMLLDPIAVMMLVVVSVIAFLVNIYSMGYMHDDASSGRFFALLSLFAFSMLGLVQAANIFQMYVFWELVGVSSYQLIGFWYHKPSAVAASKQAFILTRFADSFFLLGIVIVGWLAGTFDFTALNTVEAAGKLNQQVSLGFFSVNALAIGTILIFIGGWGKSAMFPMHIWLPNAMEGPTPVSSIIHSATMVVAGVYLTARMFPLFAAAPFTLELVTWVGAFTAIFAATIACTQKDIKRILAYSTLSQLGYMMFSLGACTLDGTTVNPLGYSASMFHVFTHAFFKCMLFLGAGAIIHVVHSNDLDAMGGLRKVMPFTYGSMLIACLAIAGVPPFSGFWSKDEILLTAWQGGHYSVFAIGLFTGGLTAFYMFRLFFLAFHGKARNPHSAHGHEDPWMTAPIVALAIPSAAAGFFAKDLFEHFFAPPIHTAGHFAHPGWLPIAASLAGVTGIAIAWLCYGRASSNAMAALQTEGRPAPYRWAYNKFYFDEMYYAFTRKVLFAKVADGIKWVDHYVIDRCSDLVAQAAQFGGSWVRRLQTGYAPLYILATLLGVLLWRALGNLPL